MGIKTDELERFRESLEYGDTFMGIEHEGVRTIKPFVFVKYDKGKIMGRNTDDMMREYVETFDKNDVFPILYNIE